MDHGRVDLEFALRCPAVALEIDVMVIVVEAAATEAAEIDEETGLTFLFFYFLSLVLN
jgi:hypothetical protein